MVNLIQNIIIWLFFAPGLLFCKDIQPWYLRVLLVVISPSTWMISMFALLVIVALNSPGGLFPEGEYNVEHRYKNTADISKVTRSYIPECDTIDAVFYRLGLEYDVCEQFRMKNKLSDKEKEKLSKECSESLSWMETDSTYEYNYVTNDQTKKTDIGYDYFRLTINKNDSLMTIHYGDY